MERNPTANNYAYYKEPVNYPTNTAYGEIYQPTYPYEDEIKERRYQQQTNMHYHQNYPKPPDTTAYKPEKTQSSMKSYSNYNFPNYKDSGQYSSYYDQYKFNMSLPAINNYSKTKDGYPHNYSTGMFPDSKVTSAFCEETNLTAKGSLMKPPPPTNPQISQYMYTNCYGYPAASYTNQNYCSYAQSCNDEARILWDDYQTNRRLLSSYVPAAPPPPPPPPPQANCRLKDNYNSEYCGSTASYPYHTESLRSREKLLYSMNSHTTPSDNLYNSRPIWPVGLQYQSMPQNMMMNSFDRLNYINDAPNYDYCSQRQDTTGFHPAYVKPTLVNSQQKHIRPTTMPTDYYNTQRFYLCNEQLNNELQDAYSQQYLRDTRHTAAYNQQVEAANARTSMPPIANEMISKDPVYNHVTVDNAYYNQNNQGSLNLTSYTDSSKSVLNKGQNLREFLSSWNEDEEDGIERMDGNENQVYLQQTNIEVENAPIENHLQFKGSFNTRPKIHVGITVDSNVANNQYINLPDIIIDIEKSKESDHISSHIETQNVGNEKLVFLESIDVPATDLSQYSNINLDENVVDQFKDCPIIEQTASLVHELDLSMETVENIEKMVLCSDDIVMTEEDKEELLKKATPKKTKRYKRILKPKTLNRMIRKTRRISQIDKSKERQMVRIKKVWKKIKKERSSFTKKTKIIAAAPIFNKSLEHSKNNEHSLHNPKTLKYLCLNLFNSEIGREYLKKSYCDEKEKKPCEKTERKLFVPKLSVLCEYALNNFYEEKNILLLNLDELDSNLYFVECDINENLIRTHNDSIESDFIELLIDDDDDDNEDDDKDETIGTTTDSNHLSLNNNNNTLDNFNEICLTSDENSRDFSSLHHEEIVPDNLHAFENEKLLKYLQSKYIQNHNYLKIFIIDKICKKYRKYILKRRRQRQQETTKKFLLSKIKEKLIKKKKHLKIGSC